MREIRLSGSVESVEGVVGNHDSYSDPAPLDRSTSIVALVSVELLRQEQSSISRSGGKIDVVRFALRPTVNWLIDPIIRTFVPETNFFVQPGAPPGLARFDGPRNFAGQKIRIE